MLHSLLREILVEPRTLQALHHADADVLVSASGQRYPLVNNIPVMLDAVSSEQHYVKHYQLDAKLFDYFEERTDGATAHDERRVYEAILHRVEPNWNTVVDVGCGRGWVARNLCERGVTVCSLDVSIENPAQALHRYPFENHCAVVADAFALPFASGSVDCVIASEIIEHVPDPAAFVQELLRIVRPGGALIVSTPYKEKLRYVLCIHCNNSTPVHAHIHSFSEHTLAQLTPVDEAIRYSWTAFGNKALLFLRTWPFLRWMPFPLWRVVDSLANMVVNKRAHIVVEWRKKSIVKP